MWNQASKEGVVTVMKRVETSKMSLGIVQESSVSGRLKIVK